MLGYRWRKTETRTPLGRSGPTHSRESRLPGSPQYGAGAVAGGGTAPAHHLPDFIILSRESFKGVSSLDSDRSSPIPPMMGGKNPAAPETPFGHPFLFA